MLPKVSTLGNQHRIEKNYLLSILVCQLIFPYDRFKYSSEFYDKIIIF